MEEQILYVKCQHLKKTLEKHELLLFFWINMDLSFPSHFLAVFSKAATWALLSTPYHSRPLRKRTVVSYEAFGCENVLAGSWWTPAQTSAGWKMPWPSAAALVLTGTTKGEILPCSLLSEQVHTQRWDFDCNIQKS